MSVKLKDLISLEEENYINKFTTVDVNKNFYSLTIAECSQLWPTIIVADSNGKMPECVLSSRVIEILTTRAIQNKLPIYE